MSGGRAPVPGLDFTAIDFETANGFRGSPCAVGAVRVRDGVMVDRAEWLIRPPVGFDRFDPRNVRIHGITEDRVLDAPRFAQVYDELADFVGTDVLAAHNAGFDVGVIESGLEELLRWATPVYHFRRTATKDVELGGKQIKEGDKVVMWFGSGNRDEDVFENPNKIDVTRKNVDHMTFGKGSPHLCLGNNLARLEIRLLLEELLDRARRVGVSRVFCLTFEVEFFRRHGFEVMADQSAVDPEVYAELLRSTDEGVAEFLDLARVKPNTLGNTRMIRRL